MPAASRVTRSRPLFPATWLGFALLAAILTGCHARGARPAASTAAQTYVAPAQAGLGRVVSYDRSAGVALVELSPFARLPASLAGRALVARDRETLALTGHLVASGRRSGTILGVYVVDGSPSAGDEVVLPPVTE